VASDTPQRRWQAACPNCGAPVEFASAASSSAVCSFCRSTLLREGEALRKIGLSAELIEDYSPLQLGAAGRYAGAPFTIVGRLQMGYAEGNWNEWHALFDSGPNGPRSAWLSEDNGSFVLSFDAPLQDERPPQAHELVLGERLLLAGQSWSIAALTQARLLAAQGELPRPPDAGGANGKPYLVAELRNAQDEVGTLDYIQPAAPQWSVGRAVRLADLAMTGLREDSSKTLGSRALPCPSCGAALEPRLGNSLSIVCGQCHAVVDISKGAGADLAHFAQENGLEPLLKLGSTGSLAISGGKPVPWQVVGYQERCDIPESGEDEQAFWREYLLFNKTEGFIFLVDTEEGWSLVRPLTGAPTGTGNAIVWKDKKFVRKYGYTAKTTYVLGEFYWQLKREERALVTDYEWHSGSRTELLSREQTGNEITWSLGRTLDATEVQRAFKLPHDNLAVLRRDSSSLSDAGGLLRKIVIGVFILVVVIMLLSTCRSDDCQAYKDSYGESSAEYQQCQRSGGGGRIAPGGGSYGGSYGGFGGGGGGHK